MKQQTSLWVTWCIASWLCGCVGLSHAEQEEVTALLDAGWTLNSVGEADLNGDGRQDAVYIQEQPDPAFVPDPAFPDVQAPLRRVLKIAVRDAAGQLVVVKQNHKIAYASDAGGMMGDPLEGGGLTVENKRFSVSHYGGSGWRWANTVEFAYSRRDNTWQLVKVEETSFHAGDAEGAEVTNVFTPPKDFGKIDIAEFDPEHFKGIGEK